MKKIIACIAFVLALAGGILCGFSLVKPHPRPAEENAAFSGILQDIAEITKVPHTAGSPENYAVRDMIVSRAESLGLSVDILPFEFSVVNFVNDYQEAYDNGSESYRNYMDNYISRNGHSTLEEFARDGLNAGDQDVLKLDNLLVKINGTAPRGSLMFVSHYDHVKGAPGAADDALAVACMLHLMEETAKQPLANDVYFLYTDGEENGLLGAADFVETQPAYADEIDVLLNFEARGNSGAMLMFETSGKDYELVRQFKNNVPQPVTLSIATAIYAMMPNGTDYTEFKNAGYHGLNFAMIEGDETYHQPTDTLENLNKDTAWQYYQTMTALGSHFGNADLEAIENTQEALYFPLPLTGIVVIPGWLGYVIGLLPLILALVLIVLTLKDRDRKPFGRILRIAGLLLLGLIPAAVTLLFFSGNYMFSIPATLFLLADLAMTRIFKKQKWAGVVVLTAAIFISAVLYTPLIILVQVALKIWYANVILGLLPILPAAAYSVKVFRKGYF